MTQDFSPAAPPPFAAVIFDCDGCLVDTEALVIAVLGQALADLDIGYDAQRYMGLSQDAFFAALDAAHRDRHDRPLPAGFPDLCTRKTQAALMDRLTEIDGAGAAVRACTAPKAVASGSSLASLQRKLTQIGLWDAFAPHVYSAEQVAHGKPAPDLFLHAAAALGVDPALCLAIEDSQNGVSSAAAAGMTVWGFCGGGHIGPDDPARLLAAGASRIIRAWPEAEAAFRQSAA
jgi:HAD superfamily hydrolase (TIGR01509 family)